MRRRRRLGQAQAGDALLLDGKPQCNLHLSSRPDLLAVLLIWQRGGQPGLGLVQQRFRQEAAVVRVAANSKLAGCVREYSRPGHVQRLHRGTSQCGGPHAGCLRRRQAGAGAGVSQPGWLRHRNSGHRKGQWTVLPQRLRVSGVKQRVAVVICCCTAVCTGSTRHSLSLQCGCLGCGNRRLHDGGAE